MRRFQFLVLAVVLSCACEANAQEVTPKFDPQRDAARDVATAVATAKAQGKNVLMDVGGEWCKWCHFLDKFIDTTPEVKSALDKNFVWVKVNWSPENKNVALLSEWPKISGYPHLFVLDAEGKLLHSQNTGLLEAEEGKNTYDKQKMMAFIGQNLPRK